MRVTKPWEDHVEECEALSEIHVLHHMSSKITAWEASDAPRKQLEHFGIKLNGGAGRWAEVYRVFKECRVKPSLILRYVLNIAIIAVCRGRRFCCVLQECLYLVLPLQFGCCNLKDEKKTFTFLTILFFFVWDEPLFPVTIEQRFENSIHAVPEKNTLNMWYKSGPVNCSICSRRERLQR